MSEVPLIDAIMAWEPVPKGRPRFERYRVVTPPDTVAAENAIRLYLPTVCLGLNPVSGPLRVFLRYVTRSPTKDLANLIKLTLDACNKLVWNDDRQVLKIEAELVRVKKHGEQPCTHLIVHQLEE